MPFIYNMFAGFKSLWTKLAKCIRVKPVNKSFNKDKKLKKFIGFYPPYFRINLRSFSPFSIIIFSIKGGFEGSALLFINTSSDLIKGTFSSLKSKSKW